LATADRAATCVAFSPDGSVLVISSTRDLQGGQSGPRAEATIKLLPIEHVLDPQVLDNQAREAAADLLRVLEQAGHEPVWPNALFALGPYARAAVPALTEALDAQQHHRPTCFGARLRSAQGLGT
jgi:hypothetical protein